MTDTFNMCSRFSTQRWSGWWRWEVVGWIHAQVQGQYCCPIRRNRILYVAAITRCKSGWVVVVMPRVRGLGSGGALWLWLFDECKTMSSYFSTDSHEWHYRDISTRRCDDNTLLLIQTSIAVVLVVNDCGSCVSYPIAFDGTNFTFATRTATSLQDLVRSISNR